MRNMKNLVAVAVPAKPLIRAMEAKDWPQVAQIYAEGMATGNATFETQMPSYESWDQSHLADCRLVAEADGKLLGWVALSPVSSRCVYGGVAEVSIYIAAAARGQGVGKALLETVIVQSEARGLWSLQAGIFPENLPSRQLHEKMGFRYIGHKEKVGKLNGVWRNNTLYERRSTTIGID